MESAHGPLESDRPMRPRADEIISTVERTQLHGPGTINPAMLTNGEAHSVVDAMPDVSTVLPSPNHKNEDVSAEDIAGHRDSTREPKRETLFGNSLFKAAKGTRLERYLAPLVRRQKVLPIATLKTGLCYDVRMRFHATVAEDDAHPEDPRRIYRIYRELCLAGLVDDPQALGPAKEDIMYRLQARLATPAEVCLVHSYQHYSFVLSTRDMDIEHHKMLTDSGDSVFFNASTYYCAMLSVGGAIETCKAVVAGLVKNAFAVIRPPGHHAVPTEAQGFCMFNNVSVAARVCQRDYPEKCRKILIFDWDVHHGNGTQDAFYDDPNLLYMSIHVHQNGQFYPAGDKGDEKHFGEGEGLGMNVNVPWTRKGMGDSEYMLAFSKIIMPIASEFDPDLVIISAGFDAADGDEIGGCFVTPACYAHMTHQLMSLAKGKVAVCLEGGYNLDSISKSALAVTRTLVGEPPDRLKLGKPSRVAEDDIINVMRLQSKFWSSMLASDAIPAVDESKAERMHDVIRSYQSQILFQNHKMISLMIQRSRLSKSFKDQVIATPNYSQAKTLLVFLHDPPEIIGLNDPRTNTLDICNTWLTDPLQDYIKWAVTKDYGVIDITVPKHLTDLDELEPAPDHEDPPSVRLTKELIVYVWENYIQVNDATAVFLIGVGDAHGGIMHLLKNNDCSQELKGVVNFVHNSKLRAASSDTDPYLGDWYHKNSLVFLSGEHAVWSASKLPKRRFGRVVKSPESRLSPMLNHHLETVQRWIENRAAQEELGLLGVPAVEGKPPSPSLSPANLSTFSRGPSINVINVQESEEKENNGKISSVATDQMML